MTQDNEEKLAEGQAELAEEEPSSESDDAASVEDKGTEAVPEVVESAEAEPEPEAEEEIPAEEAAQQPEAVESEEVVAPESALPAEETPELQEEEPAEEETPSEAPKLEELLHDPDKKWYVIHAHSGHENKVRQSIENRVRQEHLEELVGHVLIPSEEVAEVKGGKKRITSRKIFPGYVLVQMKLSHETWYLIRTTPGVTGFIGSGKTPTPLELDEIKSIFEQMRGERKKPKPKMSFEKDDKVKIIEGPFANFMGYVEEVNPERGKLKVMVEIFERLTSVELEFWQVEKT